MTLSIVIPWFINPLVELAHAGFPPSTESDVMKRRYHIGSTKEVIGELSMDDAASIYIYICIYTQLSSILFGDTFNCLDSLDRDWLITKKQWRLICTVLRNFLLLYIV